MIQSIFFRYLPACLLVLLVCCSSAPTGQLSRETMTVEPFEAGRVTLLDGPFQKAQALNLKVLLERYEPDRFLAKFRTEAGLEAKAEHYHGWEDDSLAGHSLGHYLSGCSLMFQATGDERFRERVNYMVAELDECQVSDGDGYIGAFPDGKRIFEQELARGDIRPQRFYLNGIWAPCYTQHKVLSGLLDAYRLCRNDEALKIARRFADWLDTVISPLTEEQMQLVLECEHGGINEVLAELYGITGDSKYLRMSRAFHHRAVLDPLAEGQDILPGLHGNTQIPKLIGLSRRYELTGEVRDMNAAVFFWDRVVHHHSYVTGGHGNHEYFGEPDHSEGQIE